MEKASPRGMIYPPTGDAGNCHGLGTHQDATVGGRVEIFGKEKGIFDHVSTILGRRATANETILKKQKYNKNQLPATKTMDSLPEKSN